MSIADPSEPVTHVNGFALDRARSSAILTITVAGELDIVTAPQLTATLSDEAVDCAETVWLDLSAVTFIDSSGLHALITAYERLASRLRIAPSAACLRVAEIAGVEDLLPFIELDREPSGDAPVPGPPELA